MNKRNSSFVPVIMKNGTYGKMDINTLPLKGWKTHSGHAPVANVEVHSLQSQQIDDTNNIVLKADSGARFCVTNGEAEIFALDYLKGLGYDITAPRARA